jgi:bifunctional DNA-binding transcriptional regulator/antitoxin component of YhaV-PrlF toxin-antitoxin module
MSEKQTFKVLLEKDENIDATRITIPFDVEKTFGARRVPVKVSINGADYRSTIFRMGGKFLLVIPKRFRHAAGVTGGEMITVELERDEELRVIIPPEDFAAALEANSRAKRAWEKLSYTHQREYVMAIEDAKREETRARRIAKTIEKIAPE